MNPTRSSLHVRPGRLNKVPERIEQRVLPFFSNTLSFTAPRK
jgi:hypothetical protein